MSDAAWPALPYASWKDSCATLAFVDPDRRQDPSRADTLGQPFLACAALCDGDRTDDDADPVQAWRDSDRLRFRRSRALAAHERGAFPTDRAEADVGRGVPRGRVRRPEGARHRGYDRQPAERNSRCDRLHRGQGPSRPTIAMPRTGSGASFCAPFCVVAISHRVPRQGEPGAFLLGQLRSCGHALFRPPAPRHPGGVPNLPDGVAREAYSHEVSSAGFWPGGERDRRAGLLFLRLSGA